VTGKLYASDYASPTPATLNAAVSDMEAAYTDAENRPNPDHLNLSSGNLDGETLQPGLYKWETNVTFTNSLIFDGTSTDIWILQITGTLNAASDAKITLTGGAQANNIFWQITGETTLGTSSHVEGILLGKTNIVFQNNSSLNGRALSQAIVTLDGTTIVGESGTSGSQPTVSSLPSSVPSSQPSTSGVPSTLPSSLPSLSGVPSDVPSPHPHHATIDLQTAGNYTILSKSGVTTTGATSVTGDIGTSPITASALTGFALVLDSSDKFSTSHLVTGKLYAADYASPTPARLTAAISDMEAAYTDAATRPFPDEKAVGAGILDSRTLTGGLYKWGGAVSISTSVTFDGSATHTSESHTDFLTIVEEITDTAV